MSVHILRNSSRDISYDDTVDQHAEVALVGAPYVELENGAQVIPQHYLQFQQNLASLQDLLNDIECEPNILLFAGELKESLYLQVGVIGHENYADGEQISPPKLVYGRKWLVTPDTPTSEVIQTVFLAIKKVREHEIREFIKLRHSDKKLSRPFSTHQDLPLLASNNELVYSEKDKTKEFQFNDIVTSLKNLEFCQRSLSIRHHHKIGKRILVDIVIDESQYEHEKIITLPEMENFECSLLLEDYNPTIFLYKLADALIECSDKYVAEIFKFKGYARFSVKNDPLKIGKLSRVTRSKLAIDTDEKFDALLSDFNYQTDASRVPDIGHGTLAEKNRSTIQSYCMLDGHMPRHYLEK